MIGYRVKLDGNYDVFKYELGDEIVLDTVTTRDVARDTAWGAKLVMKARSFALERHGDQDHGSLKIATHLECVVDNIIWWIEDTNADGVLIPLKTQFEMIAAAWLHDVLEDTASTVEELTELFGEKVAGMVMAVTDSPGRDRWERHCETYYRIRDAGPYTVAVKLCDRLHNQKRSIDNGEPWITTYCSEYRGFKLALYRPGMHDALWELLDAQYEMMRNVIERKIRDGKETGL